MSVGMEANHSHRDQPSKLPGYTIGDLYDAYLGYIEFANGPIVTFDGKVLGDEHRRLTADSFDEFEMRMHRLGPRQILDSLENWQLAKSREQAILSLVFASKDRLAPLSDAIRQYCESQQNPNPPY